MKHNRFCRQQAGRLATARDGPCRKGAWTRLHMAICLLVLAPALSSCLNQLEFVPQQPVSCSTRRLNVAAGMFAEAKDELLRHFEERNNQSLVVAYYLSRDVEDLSKTIRHCPDFNEVNKSRAVGLIKASRVLRSVVQRNMRDPDPMVMMSLLGSKYDEVFKSDIH